MNLYHAADYPSFDNAITTIGTSRATLVVSDTRNISTNVTSPSNITILVLPPGNFNISSGRELILLGPFFGPPTQIFRGVGTVTFGPGSVQEVFTEWWRSNKANDDTNAFVSAISAFSTVKLLSKSYRISSNISITRPVNIIGQGISETVVERNYSPSNDSDGVFNFTGGASECTLSGMTIRSISGQSGGCLISIIATPIQTPTGQQASSGIGLFRFEYVDFTTRDWVEGDPPRHKYTIYMDGTSNVWAPIGIRGVDFSACSVFGGATATMLIKGVLKFSFVGGGVYPAGGAASSNVIFTGTAEVETQSFIFAPSDCSCDLFFDHAKLGVVQCGVVGKISNTPNTSNIVGMGYSDNVQNNWYDSVFLNTSGNILFSQGAITLDVPNERFGIGVAAPTCALEARGIIAGFAQAGAVTKIGNAGAPYTTSVPNGQTMSFATGSAKLFHIATGGGAGCLGFADYKQVDIQLLSNPSSEFEASSTPTLGNTGIYKNPNDHSIYVKNNTGATADYSVLVLGPVTDTTDPA
jgi:hypothetical protein